MPRNTQKPVKSNHERTGELAVHSVWKTIQGEGPFSGHPAIFVRLFGCNLQCPMCFGISTKSRIPKLTKSVGGKIRLDHAEKGEKILTFDEDFNLTETEIVAIHSRMVDEWLEVTIDGKVYDVTSEHPFFTTRGLLDAEELRVGDTILEAKPNEILAFKKSGERNPMKNKQTAARKAANTDYQSVADKISKTRKEKFASGELLHPTETMSEEQYNVYRKKISESKRREKNPNWQEWSMPNLMDVQEAIARGEIQACQQCEKKDCRLLVHHKDGNHDNDALKNLTVWCHQCHNQHHERGYNFWNGARKDGKKLVKKHNGQRVNKIVHCRGNLEVRNISCKPYDTYLANGMWVHNCDTDYTSKKAIYYPEGLLKRIQGIQNKPCLVVLTGGEPFIQNIMPFIGLLLRRDYRVQIETNGSFFMPHFFTSLTPNLSIVCSPKTNYIGLPQHLISAWKYVVEADRVDPDDGLPTGVLGMNVRPYRPRIGDPQVKVAPIYVQPQDDQDPEKNEANTKQAVESCLKFGYILSTQVHKQVGVE